MPNEVDVWRIQKILCPGCKPNHILENGRLWMFCGLQVLIQENYRTGYEGGEFTEEEAKAMVPKRSIACKKP